MYKALKVEHDLSKHMINPASPKETYKIAKSVEFDWTWHLNVEWLCNSSI